MRVSQKEWVATQNRLEYLHDKANRQDKEIREYKDGLDALMQAYGILIKQVTFKFGGPTKEIWLPRGEDNLKGWEAKVELDADRDMIGIRLIKGEEA